MITMKLEGHPQNPPTWIDRRRHEQCEVCSHWFPENRIQFLTGSLACPNCRAVERARQSGPLQIKAPFGCDELIPVAYSVFGNTRIDDDLLSSEPYTFGGPMNETFAIYFPADYNEY